MKEIKDALIDLYLGVKVRKLSEINNMPDELIIEEEQILNKLPIMDIINYISNSIEILSDIKAQDKYEEKILQDEEKEKYINNEDLENDANGLKLYEGMLIKAESDIRNHIRVSFNFYNFDSQIEQELKLKIEDLEFDLENVINKYNNLLNKYNKLINIKKIDDNKKTNNEIINKNNLTLNNFKNKLTDRSNISTINNSNEKLVSKINIFRNIQNNNNNIKKILIQGNFKSLNSFDNYHINRLKKENERFKKLINYPKNNPDNIKRRYYLINNRIKRISDKAKRSKSKVNSKEHSYIMKTYQSKNGKNKNNIKNKSSILFLMNKNKSINQKNALIDYSILTEESFILPNKKVSEIHKNNKIYNTINISKNNETFLKKNNTNLNTVSGKGNKTSNIINKRMMNKLKVKCKDIFKEDNKSNQIRDNKAKQTNIMKNNGSFFSNTNNNYFNNKNTNRLKSFKLLNLDININDIKNNTSTNYFFNDNIKNNGDENRDNRLKTEINSTNNNNSNLIIHRNSEHKNGINFRKIKELKTEKYKNNFNLKENKKNEIFFPNENNINNNVLKKIKINRKNIFFKKSQNSLKDVINTNNQNINPNDNEMDKKIELINKENVNKRIINRFPLDNKNIKNNGLDTQKYNLNKNNEKKLLLYHNKKINENSNRIRELRNNTMKSQNNTINNISNYNNCNYIYLFK